MKKLLNTRQAAEITGFQPGTIRGFVRAGKLKANRASPEGNMRFLEADLLSLTSAPNYFPLDKDPKKKEG